MYPTKLHGIEMLKINFVKFNLMTFITYDHIQLIQMDSLIKLSRDFLKLTNNSNYKMLSIIIA